MEDLAEIAVRVTPERHRLIARDLSALVPITGPVAGGRGFHGGDAVAQLKPRASGTRCRGSMKPDDGCCAALAHGISHVTICSRN